MFIHQCNSLYWKLSSSIYILCMLSYRQYWIIILVIWLSLHLLANTSLNTHFSSWKVSFWYSGLFGERQLIKPKPISTLLRSWESCRPIQTICFCSGFVSLIYWLLYGLLVYLLLTIWHLSRKGQHHMKFGRSEDLQVNSLWTLTK